MNVLSEKTFQSSSTVLKNVREYVRNICVKQDVNAKTTENIILAVNEAGMNIIQHAYDNDPGNEFTILIAISKNEKNHGKELVIQLIDQAEKIDLEKIKSRNLSDIKPGGIGVHMIHELMDSVDYLNSNQGNILELRKTI